MTTSNTETTPTDTPMGVRETVLTLLALAAGGLSSLLIVAATTRGGLASMQVLFWAIGLPGMLLVFAIGGYADSPIVFKGLLRITSRLLKIPVVTVITTAKPNAQATVAG